MTGIECFVLIACFFCLIAAITTSIMAIRSVDNLREALDEMKRERTKKKMEKLTTPRTTEQ